MNNIVQEMVERIESHLLEGFSLEHLGKDMGYSPDYCSFKFHQITGITIKKYRSLRKMYLASMALKDPQKKIIDIAFYHGFSSQESFSRAFKNTFGISPNDYRRSPQPLQTFVKLNLLGERGWFTMDISQKLKIEALQEKINAQYDQKLLNVLNGQMMYEEFAKQQLMGNSDYVPFNEAMCTNPTTSVIFSEEFNKIRATGHQVSLEDYELITVNPLKPLLTNDYQCIVLWFGDDMFCQLNLLTVLAFLEQQGYQGKVYYHMVKEMTYDVEETEIVLGDYMEIYEQVLIQHRLPKATVLPVMYQGVQLYFNYLKEENEITTYIKKHLDMPQNDLIKQLFYLFPHYGLGDRQYSKLIEKSKE
ncbi:helix-turn-helix domain-containing protein [Lysinibacillus irui]|uniref:AraC family transcriptional regulator n=1 Tax=Lysinibacillus irui TaxID=2998077 RepID=A0AAJ5RM22_9BACI|nr:AraC family transcriptional regulator [Lysinibacillus irui]WDV08311.1 AraC family transcriptional regulator [Lysinibacillus irui]